MKNFLQYLGLFFLLLQWGCTNNSSSGETTDDSGAMGSPQVDFPDNFLQTGESANDILGNSTYDRLEVEIGHVEGFAPTQETIDNFEAFLREFTFKETIEIRLSPLASPNEETLTLNEIADLELEHRTAYNDGSTLAIYIYFTDAPSVDDDEDEGLVVLGAVYRNTSMVIFEPTIRSLVRPTISRSDLETATLNHEFGHLFGLVNLGSSMVNAHEDSSAPNHCSVDGCLMQAELTFNTSRAEPMGRYVAGQEPVSACTLTGNAVLKLFEKQEVGGQRIVPVLNAQCILDLQNNGGR